jgi:hypothetical protein
MSEGKDLHEDVVRMTDAIYYDESARMAQRWIGVDFDGTLAVASGTMEHCGEPIPAMVARVKQWLAEGKCVKILTARVSGGPHWADFTVRQRRMIELWCEHYIGQKLEVTCRKDFAMRELWDDRAVCVEYETGLTCKTVIDDLRSQVRVSEEEIRQLTGISLFRTGEFPLHSGGTSNWKIDCDALTEADWRTIAGVISRKVGHFRNVYGIPKGGLALAEALAPMITGDWRHPFLIVDDVYTTGASMREAYAWTLDTENIVGFVVFARKPVREDWIRALFTMADDE